MSKRKRPVKKVSKKVEKKTEAPKDPKLEGRKLKAEDVLRLRELRQAIGELRASMDANLGTVDFLLRTYVKKGETLKKLDLEQGAVVVQLGPATPAPPAPEKGKK